jgi:hypothetical protein
MDKKGVSYPVLCPGSQIQSLLVGFNNVLTPSPNQNPNEPTHPFNPNTSCWSRTQIQALTAFPSPPKASPILPSVTPSWS